MLVDTGLTSLHEAHFVCVFTKLADHLVFKWERSHRTVMCCRLSFTILRATIVCLIGAHTKWRGIGFDDCASIMMS